MNYRLDGIDVKVTKVKASYGKEYLRVDVGGERVYEIDIAHIKNTDNTTSISRPRVSIAAPCNCRTVAGDHFDVPHDMAILIESAVAL